LIPAEHTSLRWTHKRSQLFDDLIQADRRQPPQMLTKALDQRRSKARLKDAEDSRAFEAAITADYDAPSAAERELVLRLASLLWRLRRATTMETGLFEIRADHLSQISDERHVAPKSRHSSAS
jgi:hypothetical protein